MAQKYIIHKRQNKILYTEFIIASVATAAIVVILFKLHPAICLLIAIVSFLLLFYLFFLSKIFRYIFSILFSFGWAIWAFKIGLSVDKNSNITAWVFAIVIFAISVWAHWDHFTFLKQAKVYEYERQ